MTEGVRIDKETVLAETKALIARATTIEVRTPPTRQDAATLWSLIRTARKATEAEQDRVCGPLKTAYEDTRKPYLELRKECESWEERLQAAMSGWDREQDRLARVAQAKLQAQIDAQNAKILEKAEAKGIEPVLRVVPVVQAPPKSIATQAGTVQGRSERTVYGMTGSAGDDTLRADAPIVADLLTKFPSLFVLDWVAFRKLASTGMLDAVPGVERKIEYVYAQRK